MKRPTKDDERRLLGHVSNVAELVNDGASPNDAIVKVASDNSLPPWQIRLMVNAYNTGRASEQRTSSHELFDKVAEFEMADPAVILNAIYPSKVKTAAERHREEAVSEEYEWDVDWLHRKNAATATFVPPEDYDWGDPILDDLPRDPTRLDRKIRGGLHKLADERERLAVQLDETYDKIAASFRDLEGYFRNFGGLPLEDVRTNSEAFWGQPADDIFDKLAEMCCTEPMRIKKPAKPKKPEAAKAVVIKKSSVTSHAMRRDRAPYLYVDAIVKAAADHQKQLDEALNFEKAAFSIQLELERALVGSTAQPLDPDFGLSVVRRLNGEKRAGLLTPMSGTVGEGAKLMMGAEAAKSLMKRLNPEPDSKIKDDAFADVSDPSHEAQIRSIRAQAALHGIMNSPYFEGEDPNHVTGLFNDLTKMYPRMAEQPLLLETAMKRLAAQGSADTHDLDQLLGIETKLKQRDALPTGTSNVIETVYPKATNATKSKSQGSGGDE